VALAHCVTCYCGSYNINWGTIHAASLMMELSALAPMLQFLSLHLKIKRTGALSRLSLIMLMRDLAFGNVDKSELSRVFRT
jgi:hypothetical protein